MLPLFALTAVYFVLRGGTTIVSVAIFASSLLTQLLPSLLFSLMKKPFGNRHAAFAGILAGGAVLAFMMTTGSILGTLFPAAPRPEAAPAAASPRPAPRWLQRR